MTHLHMRASGRDAEQQAGDEARRRERAEEADNDAEEPEHHAAPGDGREGLERWQVRVGDFKS